MWAPRYFTRRYWTERFWPPVVASGATFPEDSFPTTLTAPMTEYALSVEGERYDLTVTQTEFRLTFEG